MADGTRTRDVLDHNQVLYQLNYSHHVPFSGSRCQATTKCYLKPDYKPNSKRERDLSPIQFVKLIIIQPKIVPHLMNNGDVHLLF